MRTPSGEDGTMQRAVERGENFTRRHRSRERRRAVRRRAASAGFALVLGLALSLYAHAADTPSARAARGEGEPVRHVIVTLNKSRTLHLERPFTTAVIGSPDIADVLPVSDRELYIQGKKVGTTNLSVYDQAQRLVSVLDVAV